MSGHEHKRSIRVAERIRAELMNVLLTGAVRDPGVQEALVSNVLVTDDLRLAKVYLRLLESNVDEARQRRLLRSFERAKGFLRRELGVRLQLKYTPELRFYWDDVLDEALHMESVLAEVREPDEPSGD